MTATLDLAPTLDPEICTRALDARDPRFDGLFFVGITSTRIYCRPICPARVSVPDHRRFFDSAASAELAGYRPCLRCRPELAPGRGQMDAVSRLARNAAQCIEAGALNGHGVGDLARDLGVSERHLRRALERELGVSPVELARTHRLLLAKRLLADTSLSVTRVAFASGFQSLRRFNAVFRERYRLSPSAVRRPLRESRDGTERPADPVTGSDLVRLTLAYRPPMAWNALLDQLRAESLPCAEVFEEGRYGRTVRMDGRTGVVFVSHAGSGRNQVVVDVSPSLLPVLMPLLSRLRALFDLDAQPTLVDQHLAATGLADRVERQPGVRVAGSLDGFEAAFRVLLREGVNQGGNELAGRVMAELGEPLFTGFTGLVCLAPKAERVAAAGAEGLSRLGVPAQAAGCLAALAREMATGRLKLEPHCELTASYQALLAVPGMSRQSATTIVMRSLTWPDAFNPADPALQRAAGEPTTQALSVRAELWRPWRAYAAQYLKSI